MRIDRRPAAARRRPVVAGTRKRSEQTEDTPQDISENNAENNPVDTPEVPAVDLGVDEPESAVDEAPVESAESTVSESAVDEPAEDEAFAHEPTTEAGSGSGPATGARLWVATIAIALVIAGAGVWMLIVAGNAEKANSAVVDGAASSEVTSQVSTAVEQVFSYRFDDTAATDKAAADLLTGEAPDQYAKLVDLIRKHAPEQKLVVVTKVALAGVTFLSGDDARLLVFVDQSASRADTGAENAGPAQLGITAHRNDGKWQISEIHPYQ